MAHDKKNLIIVGIIIFLLGAFNAHARCFIEPMTYVYNSDSYIFSGIDVAEGGELNLLTSSNSVLRYDFVKKEVVDTSVYKPLGAIKNRGKIKPRSKISTDRGMTIVISKNEIIYANSGLGSNEWVSDPYTGGDKDYIGVYASQGKFVILAEEKNKIISLVSSDSESWRRVEIPLEFTKKAKIFNIKGELSISEASAFSTFKSDGTWDVHVKQLGEMDGSLIKLGRKHVLLQDSGAIYDFKDSFIAKRRAGAFLDSSDKIKDIAFFKDNAFAITSCGRVLKKIDDRWEEVVLPILTKMKAQNITGSKDGVFVSGYYYRMDSLQPTKDNFVLGIGSYGQDVVRGIGIK